MMHGKSFEDVMSPHRKTFTQKKLIKTHIHVYLYVQITLSSCLIIQITKFLILILLQSCDHYVSAASACKIENFHTS